VESDSSLGQWAGSVRTGVESDHVGHQLVKGHVPVELPRRRSAATLQRLVKERKKIK